MSMTRKKADCILGILLALIWITLGVCTYLMWTKEKSQSISSIISPKCDYVDYDPMENPSDSLAMYLQELRCND